MQEQDDQPAGQVLAGEGALSRTAVAGALLREQGVLELLLELLQRSTDEDAAAAEAGAATEAGEVLAPEAEKKEEEEDESPFSPVEGDGGAGGEGGEGGARGRAAQQSRPFSANTLENAIAGYNTNRDREEEQEQEKRQEQEQGGQGQGPAADAGSTEAAGGNLSRRDSKGAVVRRDSKGVLDRFMGALQRGSAGSPGVQGVPAAPPALGGGAEEAGGDGDGEGAAPAAGGGGAALSVAPPPAFSTAAAAAPDAVAAAEPMVGAEVRELCLAMLREREPPWGTATRACLVRVVMGHHTRLSSP
jgi:hypothetical protein